MRTPQVEIQQRYTFVVVDDLPHGLAVARRDTDGDIVTYLSRAVTLDQIAAELQVVNTKTAAGYIVEQRCHAAS
jgi:hypothetical protein